MSELPMSPFGLLDDKQRIESAAIQRPSTVDASGPLLLDLENADILVGRMESDLDLLQFEIDGWCVWPLLRMGVQLELQPQQWSHTDGLTLGRRMALAAKSLGQLAALGQAENLVVTHYSNRSEQINDLYDDIFVDDLLAETASFIKIEYPDKPGFAHAAKQARIKAAAVTTPIELLSGLLVVSARPREVLATATRLSACLHSWLGSTAYTPSRIARSLLNFYWSKRIWSRLLDRIRPKCLLIVNAFGSYGLLAAAKERGIRVIEFQHGYVNAHHGSYSWTRYALPYKARMPIPDQIFLYGDYWKKGLMANGFWDRELAAVGSLRMDRYRSIKSSVSTQPGSLNVVVTTQGIEREKLISFLVDFLHHPTVAETVKLFVKLHLSWEPDKTPYVAALGSFPQVRVIGGHEMPSTFELLTTADLHVSLNSTCHYEAIGLGVPTAILRFTGYEFVAHLHEDAGAFLVDTPAQLIEALQQLKNERYSNFGQELFTPGALRNMQRELNA